jgi:uncharacterized protein YecT (DUF1311 family)
MENYKLLPNAYVSAAAVLVAAAAVVASTSTLASAATPKSAARAASKKTADPCAYPATEDALASCRKREYDGIEGDLAKLVATLNKTYAPDAALAGAFSTAQTKWREFRDAECKLETYDSQGGTAYDSYWLECLAKLDRDRIRTLEDLRDHP